MYSEICYTFHTFSQFITKCSYNRIWLEKHCVSSHQLKTKNEHHSPSHTKYNTVQLCTGAQGHRLASSDISELTAIHRCSKQVVTHKDSLTYLLTYLLHGAESFLRS